MYNHTTSGEHANMGRLKIIYLLLRGANEVKHVWVILYTPSVTQNKHMDIIMGKKNKTLLGGGEGGWVVRATLRVIKS